MYIVGARYRKSKLKLLRLLGFNNEDVHYYRCGFCTGKAMIHRNSLSEWEGFDYTLICGECVDRVEGDPVIKCVTPYAQIPLSASHD